MEHNQAIEVVVGDGKWDWKWNWKWKWEVRGGWFFQCTYTGRNTFIAPPKRNRILERDGWH